VGSLLAPDLDLSQSMSNASTSRPVDDLSRSWRLSERSVVPYLVDRGLLDARAIVDGDVVVFDLSRRNVGFRVTTTIGQHFFVKQGIGDERAESVAREAEFLTHAAGPLDEHLPSVRDWNERQRILVLHLVPGARSLAEHHRRIGRAAVDAARQVGHALRALHRWQVDASSPICGMLAKQPPPVILSIHRPDLRVFDQMSGSGLEIIRIVQASPDLRATLDLLHERWQPNAVVHGDVKWDNVVLKPVEHGSRRFQVQLVDWEMVRLGDPLWDAASFLSQFFESWIASMPPAASSPQAQARSAVIPLSTLQPAIRAFWDAYSDEIASPPDDRIATIEMLMKYVAARLIQFAVEAEQMSAVLSATSVVRLQVAQNIVQRPMTAATSLLGLRV
jgi:thiamine kinase-like enzyme